MVTLRDPAISKFNRWLSRNKLSRETCRDTASTSPTRVFEAISRHFDKEMMTFFNRVAADLQVRFFVTCSFGFATDSFPVYSWSRPCASDDIPHLHTACKARPYLSGPGARSKWASESLNFIFLLETSLLDSASEATELQG